MANQAWQITAPPLVRIQAISLNYRDIFVTNNNPNYIVPAKPALIPCCDGAGILESTGPNSIWQPGDRVFFHPNTWHTGSDP
ncbi:putative GroES-like superfamily protein [Septoria linicola]|nr:putative GroES-like superfamily protein [Septoria linicola]